MRKRGVSAAGPGPALGFRLIHQRLQGKETLESSSSGSHRGREMLISEREREREGPSFLRRRLGAFPGTCESCAALETASLAEVGGAVRPEETKTQGGAVSCLRCPDMSESELGPEQGL